jgi:hypothetical protein
MGHNTKTTSRTEAIHDARAKLVAHAEAIHELRRVVSLDSTVSRVGREAAHHAIQQLREYLELPWWKRFLIELKGEYPWKQPAQSSLKPEGTASEAQTGAPSSTSSPTDAPAS